MSFVSFDAAFSPVFQYSDQWMVIFFLRDSIVSWMMYCSSMRERVSQDGSFERCKSEFEVINYNIFQYP